MQLTLDITDRTEEDMEVAIEELKQWDIQNAKKILNAIREMIIAFEKKLDEDDPIYKVGICRALNDFLGIMKYHELVVSVDNK